MSNILTKIEQIASHEGITIGALERSIGASKGVLSRAINNGTDIQAKWLVRIVENYPRYSPSWLLTGEGEMLKSCPNKPTSSSSIAKKSPKEKEADNHQVQSISPIRKLPQGSKNGIPLIPVSAMAGAFTSDISVMEYECERYVVPSFEGADFLIPVKGDSMQPTYLSGDLVACQKMSLTDIFFQWNKTYVLDTDQGPLIKRVCRGSDNEHIRLVSDNDHYPPFELPLSHLHAIALVRGIIRLE